MIDATRLKELISSARKNSKKRNFTQSFEMYIVLDSKRVSKEDIQLNEVIHLPNKFTKQPRVAFLGSGDLALRARNLGVHVVPPEEIDRLSTNKREARKLARGYDFFIAEASLMPRIGRALGRFLGPRGKMPMPLTVASPIETIVERLRSSVRIRSRGQFSLSAKIGDEGMPDDKIAENAVALLNSLKDKLPLGEKSIKKIVIKTTMGRPVEEMIAAR